MTSSLPINILTMNVWGHYIVHAPRKMERITAIIEEIKERKELDVICIQELFLMRVGWYQRSLEMNFFTEKLKEMGYIYQTDPTLSLPRYLGQNSGLLIVSRLPILETTSNTFTNGSTTEYPNNKGFIGTLLKVSEEKKIYICTTHLDAHSDVKLLQISQICEHLRSVHEKGIPIVVVGDLNICPRTSSQNYERLVESFAAFELVDIVDPEQVTHIKGGTLDHVFISQCLLHSNYDCKLWQHKQVDLPLSDHYGITCTVQHKEDE